MTGIPYPVNTRAPTSARQPEPTGICFRCGFYYHLADLEFQWEWAGPRLINRQILVCRRTCLDRPNQQLRTIRIGPDPIPPKRPSPTFYAQQNQGGTQSSTQFPPLPDDPP
jgi:hypothetical protein